MKKTIWERLRVPVIASIAVLLIMLGVGLVVGVFHRYENIVLENTDNQLFSLARSVDHSVESHLERYAENLVHTLEHQERQATEEIWRNEGDSEPLLGFLQGSLLGQDERIAAVLVLQDKNVVLSTDGNTEYDVSLLGGTEDVVSLRLCKDKKGNTYLAFTQEVESGFEYAAIANLASFYETITGNVSSELQNEIVMMDMDKQVLIHRSGTDVAVEQVSDFTENDSKFSMLSFLLNCQEAGEEGTDFCDAVSSATGQAYTARMVVVPAEEETNGFFAVGASTDYEQTIEPMQEGAVWLMVYGCMALLGVAVLLIMLIQAFKGNQRAQKELDMLREKNAAMEELNRQTQELAHHQRLELMGTLTSGIAHEFNNLLAPIMGYSILALEKLPSEETELYDEILEIYNTSRKAKTVVSRLSDLARKNANTGFQKLLMDDLVRKTVELANPAKPKPVEVQLNLKCGEQTMVGNETELSQIILNLVVNAFHAMEEKGGTLTITTEMKEAMSKIASERKIVLIVKDTGCGIAKENLSRIYEPFFTTKSGGKGTGLGLAIVWQMVEDHKGNINVESEEGVGTTFTIEFPVNNSES